MRRVFRAERTLMKASLQKDWLLQCHISRVFGEREFPAVPAEFSRNVLRDIVATVGSAVVLGASGSVGAKLVLHLLAIRELHTLLLIGRRKQEQVPVLSRSLTYLPVGLTRLVHKYNADKRIHQHVLEDINEESLLGTEEVMRRLQCQAGFITMGVGAPSKTTPAELERVDVLLPTAFAKAAKGAGVRHMGLLTSVGSDINATASVFTGTSAGGGLYVHLKGQVEKNIRDLGFESTAIYQPVTLVGAAATPATWGWLAPKFNVILPAKYNSIDIHDLGQAMAYGAVVGLRSKETGVKTYCGTTLFDLCKDAAKEIPAAAKPKTGAAEEQKSDL